MALIHLQLLVESLEAFARSLSGTSRQPTAVVQSRQHVPLSGGTRIFLLVQIELQDGRQESRRYGGNGEVVQPFHLDPLHRLPVGRDRASS